MNIIPFQNLVHNYYSDEEFVIFDTETGGLNTYHDDIIEVAGLIWKRGEELKTFEELMCVNTNKISKGAWMVHKIPKQKIEAARPPSEVLNDFIEFCGDRTLVAHNIRFDYDMLNSNLIRNGLQPYQNDQVVCSLNYAREQMLPGKLHELARHYKVELEDTALHRALYDVQVLKEIMERMMKENEPEEMQYSLKL